MNQKKTKNNSTQRQCFVSIMFLNEISSNENEIFFVVVVAPSI